MTAEGSPRELQGGSRIAPTSARGERTRRSLIAAARTVFERDGFTDARIKDIAQAAGVAIGSFYTYFATKDEVFVEVMSEVQDEMLHPRLDGDHDDDPAHLIERANRAYLEVYRRNAPLMSVLEEVANVDPEFREFRRQRGVAFAERTARAIRTLQERGVADPTLDPLVTARALTAMVGRSAYQAYVLGERVEFELLVQTLTRLWLNALRYDG